MTYLEEYVNAIQNGDLIVGQELLTALEKLIQETQDLA